ncbi:MAG: ribosomal protein S18-alanine N-acetyltransferase [Terriglobia bacterium]
MKIRPFAPSDLRGLLLIQEEAALGSGWDERDYLRLNETPGGLILVASEESLSPVQITGFAALNCVLDHAELLNMAVAAGWRQRGIGKKLLLEACRRVHGAGARSISLEVRPSNLAAVRLYHSAGFITCRTRQNYYADPVEDACVMMLELLCAAPGGDKDPPDQNFFA